MSEEITWRKGISKQGKFPKKAFSAILRSIYPSENSKGTKLLQLEFQDDSQIGIYGIGKAKITDDGIEVGGSLADFQQSLEALGYECQWGLENNEILGFKTEPDIMGCKLYMQPLEEQEVGDDTQTKKSVFWGIVTKVEQVTKAPTPTPVPVTKPGKLPKKPVTKEPEASKVDITGIVIDALDEPKTISELFQGLGKAHRVSELRDAISALKSQGMVTEVNGKWQVT
jgi:hypothetical protein